MRFGTLRWAVRYASTADRNKRAEHVRAALNCGFDEGPKSIVSVRVVICMSRLRKDLDVLLQMVTQNSMSYANEQTVSL